MDFYNEAPKDYVSLNLGSQSATETSASALPQAPPSAGALTLGPEVPPPPGYGPGQTSAAGMKMDDSFLSKVGNFFIGAGTQPGDINAVDKQRLAKHEAFLKDSQNRLAWANYHDSHAVIQDNLNKSNRQAIHDGMEFATNVKGHLSSLSPEDRAAIEPMYTKMLNQFHPELASIPKLFNQNPARMLGFDSVAADPNLGPGFQMLAAGRPYVELIKDPNIAAYIDMHGRDTINKVNSRISAADKLRIAKGEVKQDEFETLYATAMHDESLAGAKPVDYAFAKHALNTPYGEEIMAGMGVNTNKLVLAKAKKEKPDGSETMSGIQAKEYRKLEAQLAFEKEHPGSFTPEQLANASKQMGILLKTESKDQSENPNNSVIQRFRALAVENGVAAENMDDIKKMKAGSPGQKLALSLWNQAQVTKDQAAAMGQVAGKVSMPHNMVDKPVYKLDKTGNPVRLKTPLSEGEYLTGQHGFTMTDSQKEKMGQLQYVEAEGNRLLDMADKAYKATSTAGRAQEVSVEAALSSKLTAWTVSGTHEDMSAYVQERNALLGKFSKGLGGEVGVLTDQDIARVVNIFPTASDTAKIRKMKRNAFNSILKLNKEAITNMLTSNIGGDNEGTVTPEQMAKMKADPDLRQKINGILGSAEGLSTPGETKQTEVPRGESLLDRMKAGH